MSIAETITAAAPAQLTGGALATSIVGVFFGHLWGYLPGTVAVIGGMLAIVWYSLMIWECETVKTWRKRHAESVKLKRTNKIAKQKLERIASLKAEQQAISAELADLEPTAMVVAAEAAANTPAAKAPPRPPSDPLSDAPAKPGDAPLKS